jgi:hypothetical protein
MFAERAFEEGFEGLEVDVATSSIASRNAASTRGNAKKIPSPSRPPNRQAVAHKKIIPLVRVSFLEFELTPLVLDRAELNPLR